MYLETRSSEAKVLSPFLADGSFDCHLAISIISHLKAAGDFELAETLELLNEFFRTSESYIFDMAEPSAFELPSAGFANTSSQSISA